jgi:hypothetical protein
LDFEGWTEQRYRTTTQTSVENRTDSAIVRRDRPAATASGPRQNVPAPELQIRLCRCSREGAGRAVLRPQGSPASRFTALSVWLWSESWACPLGISSRQGVPPTHLGDGLNDLWAGDMGQGRHRTYREDEASLGCPIKGACGSRSTVLCHPRCADFLAVAIPGQDLRGDAETVSTERGTEDKSSGRRMILGPGTRRSGSSHWQWQGPLGPGRLHAHPDSLWL